MSIAAALILPDSPVLIPEVGRGFERAYLKTLGGCRRAAARARALDPDLIVVLAAAGRASLWPRQGGHYDLNYDDLGAGELNRSVPAAVAAAETLRDIYGFADGADAALADAARTVLSLLRPLDPAPPVLVAGVPAGDLDAAHAAGVALRTALAPVGGRALIVIAGALAAEPPRGAPGIETPALRFAADLRAALAAGDAAAIRALDGPARDASGESVLAPLVALTALHPRLDFEEFSAEAPQGRAFAVALLSPPHFA